MPLDSNVYNYTPSVNYSSGQSSEALVSTEHILQPAHGEAIDKVISSPDWIFGIIILIFLILAWVRVYHFKRLKQLVQAFIYKLHVHTIIRSNDALLTRIAVGLNAIFVLSMSLFIYQLMEFYEVALPFAESVNSFLPIVPFVLLVYPLKSLLLRLVGWIFKDTEKISEYIFNVFLLNKILGLSLLPIVVLITYLASGQKVLLHMGVAMVVLFYIYRLYRGISISMTKSSLSQFYIFLYLCTLEILPMILITRFVSSEL